MKFQIQIGRNATLYYKTTIEADSLEEAKDNLTNYGYDTPDNVIWEEDGFSTFDDIESCSITDPSGITHFCTPTTEWEIQQ